jgi:hypothetical protein
MGVLLQCNNLTLRGFVKAAKVNHGFLDNTLQAAAIFPIIAAACVEYEAATI